MAALLAGGCGQGHPQGRAAKAPTVVVTTPIREEVTDYQDFTGRLSALKTVEVRARVSGYIKEAPFKEGDLVHEGDLLFQIDPRSYQADLNQALANLKLAEAQCEVQEKNAERAKSLQRSRVIPTEDYDTILATLAKDRATVEAMQASRDRAKLFLDWTRVTAPLTGRISRRLVDPGNLVNADQTLLTTIVTEDPMYVYFDVDERTFLDLTGPGSPGLSSRSFGLDFPVLLRLANEEEFRQAGTVNFIDNQVSPTSGTIKIRGLFHNPSGTLKAGLFARVRVPTATPFRALLIPDEAVRSDQGRKFVYVLGEKDEVVYRSVELGQAIHELRVIKKGVEPGDRVVVSGAQQVRPGMPVEVRVQAPPARPESPLTRLLAAQRPAPGKQGAAGAQ
jgi:RND family efflux transporter MFP subunit